MFNGDFGGVFNGDFGMLEAELLVFNEDFGGILVFNGDFVGLLSFNGVFGLAS